MIQDFLTAVRFLTVVPLGDLRRSSGLDRAMAFFPAVGFLTGLLSLGIFLLALKFFPERAAVLFLLAAPLLLNGGLHLDGFADFCDGFFGGRDQSSVLRIMKDPHLGVWGTLGLVLLLLAKFEFLQVLPARSKVFLLAMTASRWAQVLFGAFLPYARPEGGLGESVAGKVSRGRLAAATAFLIPVVLWNGGMGIALIAALIPFLFLLGLFFKQKIGGMTGDLYGAVSESTELFIFAAVCLFFGIQHG